MRKTHRTRDLWRIMEQAAKVGETRLHLGLLVGDERPSPWLPVADLHEVVSGTGEASMTFDWDGETGLKATGGDGSVIKAFVLQF